MYDHIGEGAYEETEKKIQELLKEKAAREGKALDFSGTAATEVAKTATVGMIGVSPETYFGAFRNSSYAGNVGYEATGSDIYKKPGVSLMSRNKFYLDGPWGIFNEYIQSEGAGALTFKYSAMNMYLVAASKDGTPIDLEIYQDGVKLRTVTVKDATLYQLVNNKGVEQHTLEIRVPKAGAELYTFTFG